MLSHVPRLPFSLDPLIAEAKRRMRRRRLLGAALVLALAGVAAAATFALRGASGPSQGSATGSFSNVSFSAPAGWTRVEWSCWLGPFPRMVLFTTARPTPTCGDGTFPPRERLGRDGVAVWLVLPAPPLNVRTVTRPNARIGGQPARIASPPAGGLGGSQWVTCAAGPRRLLGARIEDPGYSDSRIVVRRGVLSVAAVVCGPDYAKGETAVRQMLANLRFTT